MQKLYRYGAWALVIGVLLIWGALPLHAQDPETDTEILDAENSNGFDHPYKYEGGSGEWDDWSPPINVFDEEEDGLGGMSYVSRLEGSIISPPRFIPDFTLASTTGEDISYSDYRGKVLMIYMGYLTCPDVCPTTMADLLRAYRGAGEPENVEILFITIDPERDTQEYMARYVNAFHEDFVGLMPEDQAQVDEIASYFGLIYERREVDSAVGYLMDHSAAVYMTTPDGRIVSQYPFGVPYTELENDMQIMSQYTIDTPDYDAMDFETEIVGHTPDREYRITIPDGTGTELRMGRDPGVIPLTIELWLGEQDILVLENHDNADYLVGGIWVAPFETVYKQFYEPQTFVGLCTVTVGRDLVEIIVAYPPETAE